MSHPNAVIMLAKTTLVEKGMRLSGDTHLMIFPMSISWLRKSLGSTTGPPTVDNAIAVLSQSVAISHFGHNFKKNKSKKMVLC